MAEFERAANAVLANPKIGARFLGTRRRYFLRRFPYSIIYHACGAQQNESAFTRQEQSTLSDTIGRAM